MARRPTPKFSITEKDLGWSKIKAEAQKLAKKPFVKIGIQGESGLKPKKKRGKVRGETASPGFTVVDIATVHEYGSPDKGIPERSFIRSTMDQNAVKYSNIAAGMKDQILNANSPLTTEKALEIIGQIIEADIKNKFTNNNWPELKDPTRGGKNPTGDAKPLLDTAQTVNSIRYQVFKEGGGGKK